MSCQADLPDVKPKITNMTIQNKLSHRVRFFLFVFVLLFFSFAWGWYAVFARLPDIDSIPAQLNQPSMRITDRNGLPLYEILPEQGGRHAVVPLSAMAECVPEAAIAVEDKNFYNHPGVDLSGMIRSLWINLQGGSTIAGGSTITQQVARNLLLKDELSERTLRRKLREIVLAWQLDRGYSKDEILALYLNQTFYGGFAYGIDAAARTYFGKPASDLLPAECALLAGLPQAPGLYNPFDHPQAAKERQMVVLELMKKSGVLTAQEQILAGQMPLSYNAVPFPIQAPHFIWMVKSRVDALVQEGLLDAHASLVVRTSLDLNAQKIAENAVSRQIQKFKDDNGLDHHVNNAAVVALDPSTGEILALVGSADYFNTSIAGAVNMATAVRQPGSAFKPFIYAQAFDPLRPHPWTAATPLLDVQTVFPTHTGESYVPADYDGREHGLIPARVALASSLNIPAVLTLQEVGIDNVIGLANRLGISSLDSAGRYDLSLALGGGEMSLLELTHAYAAFAAEGYSREERFILDIKDAGGTLLYQPESSERVQVFDPRVAWLISDILSDDAARQMGFGKNSTLKIERPAAVKTGTTTNYHDNWTVGYTPALVVGVWVGNSDYHAMRNVNGLTGAAPIWQETIRAILRGTPAEPFTRPEGLVQKEVCAFSGLLAGQLCERRGLEWFIEGTEPVKMDDVYQQVWLDVLTGGLATAETPPERRTTVTVLNLPLQAQRWAHSQGFRLASDFAPVADAQSPALILISPQRGAKYQMTEKLGADAQQIPVEVLVGSGLVDVSIWMDGEILERFDTAPYVTWYQLQAGTHRFWAEGLDAQGHPVRSETVEIIVSQ